MVYYVGTTLAQCEQRPSSPIMPQQKDIQLLDGSGANASYRIRFSRIGFLTKWSRGCPLVENKELLGAATA